jgi:hypothetical protein
MLERAQGENIAARQGESESREKPSTREEATFAERQFGPMTTRTVVEGKNDPDKYESFSMQKFEWTDDKVIWISFVGLGHSEDPKIPTEGLSFVPSVGDLIPKQGTSFVFNGPPAIAGYTPEQCIRSTESVMQAVNQIAELYPYSKIRIMCFSSGTHLGFYAANQLGKKRGEAVDRLVALAPGESIAYGIYSTWVTEPLAQDLEARGITKELYDQAIAPYTQRENLDYLPAGRNLVIHAGTTDTFIPTDNKGGPNDLVARLEKKGKHPTYVLHEGRDHVTLPLAFILGEKFGRDPYNFRQNRDAWNNPGTFTDELFMKSVQGFLSRFTEDGLRKMAYVLAERNTSVVRDDMKPHEHAVAEGLVSLGVGEFSLDGQLIAIEKDKRENDILGDPKKRKVVEENLQRAIDFVKDIGTSDTVLPQYETQKFNRAA